MSKNSLFLVLSLIIVATAGCTGKKEFSEKRITSSTVIPDDYRNILLNPSFEFHNFEPHRMGKAVSYLAKSVPFWSTENYGDVTVMRESHIPIAERPDFAVDNGVNIAPGKSITQFFTLPEAGLRNGDFISMQAVVFQHAANGITARLNLMKIDGEAGSWSPRNFGMADKRTFPKQSRGELVVESSKNSSATGIGLQTLKIEAFPIVAKPGMKPEFTPGDCDTVGVLVEFINNSDKPAWVYSPSLVRGKRAFAAIGCLRTVPEYYRSIPRFMQKLWKGEPVHIVVMGSSIDRGSANPMIYQYDENPSSATYKQPLQDCKNFSPAKAGRPDLEDQYAQSRYFYSYAARLKRALMVRYNLPADKILVNFMACDGSCIGESHSGLLDWTELRIPPEPELNGHKSGKSWQELYPEIFSRPSGPRPDLVIFGSGANEKTDTPDECAVFEGAIRLLQRHYPGIEFIFCLFQNRGGYTPNSGDFQALSLHYQIPFIDFGSVFDRLLSCANYYALTPKDGHPQGAGHYLWFKQLEKGFMAVEPTKPGIAQQQLPEKRMHINTYNWEGEMLPSTRFTPEYFIVEDGAFNCWANGTLEKDLKLTRIYVDGKVVGAVRRPYPKRNLRNSFFRFGNLKAGDRHVVEVDPKSSRRFTAVDMKHPVNRNFYPVPSPSQKVDSVYGQTIRYLQPGESVSFNTDLANIYAPAWLDCSNGGLLKVMVSGKVFRFQTDQPYKFLSGKTEFLPNRKALPRMKLASRQVTITAEKAPVALIGLYTYNTGK